MKVAVPLCKRDEALFLRTSELWKDHWPDLEIFILPCAVGPPDLDLEYSLPMRWMNRKATTSMLGSLKHLVDKHNLDHITKLDADIFFKSVPEWLVNIEHGFTGFQSRISRFYICGGCYTITSDVIKALYEESKNIHTIAEDDGISRCARKIGVQMNKKSGFYGWHHVNHEKSIMLHLGQDHPRHDTLAALESMQRLLAL